MRIGALVTIVVVGFSLMLSGCEIKRGSNSKFRTSITTMDDIAEQGNDCRDQGAGEPSPNRFTEFVTIVTQIPFFSSSFVFARPLVKLTLNIKPPRGFEFSRLPDEVTVRVRVPRLAKDVYDFPLRLGPGSRRARLRKELTSIRIQNDDPRILICLRPINGFIPAGSLVTLDLGISPAGGPPAT